MCMNTRLLHTTIMYQLNKLQVPLGLTTTINVNAGKRRTSQYAAFSITDVL